MGEEAAVLLAGGPHELGRLSCGAVGQEGVHGYKDTLPVSLTAVYSKLNGMEEAVIAEMVRYMASRLAPVIEAMEGSFRR